MPKEAIINVTFDRLRAFVNGDVDSISDADQKILERLDYAYDQLKIETRANAAKRIVRKFKVSIQQARADIRQCIRLFNPINRTDVEWLETFIIENAKLQVITAEEEGNHRALALARGHLIKMYALMTDKQADIDPEMLGHNNYFAVVANGGKAIKFNLDKVHQLPLEQRFEITEDILYEEIDSQQAKQMMNE